MADNAEQVTGIPFQHTLQITELRNCWHSLLFMNGGFVYISEFLPLLKVTIKLQLRVIYS